MREDLERSELKGVLPAIVVFMARTGKEIKGIDYLSLDKAGAVVQGFQGSTRGAKVTFTDSATGAQKVLYYFTSDLSDDALKRNPGLLRFCEGLGPSNSLLKAASYLLHEGGFETVRNFLLQNSVAVLQDDSGIPVHFFAPDRWTLRFFGIYTGPIELFKNFYQADLRQSLCSELAKAAHLRVRLQVEQPDVHDVSGGEKVSQESGVRSSEFRSSVRTVHRAIRLFYLNSRRPGIASSI